VNRPHYELVMQLLRGFRAARLRMAALVLAAEIAGSEPSLAGTMLVNGGFDGGAGGWTLIGGASVVTTGEPFDNPYGRLPDGGQVFLYQEASSAAPGFTVSFDFFSGLMSAAFPSPGGFPDTAFASMYFGASEGELRPELFQSGDSVTLFDYDAANGTNALLTGATLTNSPARSGWTRFSGSIAGVSGQPFFALTFQNVNGNGVPADSAFLVDNVEVEAIPEPGTAWTVLAMITGFSLLRRFRGRERERGRS
jgi:hypothetical protein